MFIAGNFLAAFAEVLNVILSALYWLILIRALISWVNPDPYNPIVRFLHQITEPLLAPVRRILPFSLKMAMDISPLIVFLLIIFLKSFLVRSFFDMAYRLKMQ